LDQLKRNGFWVAMGVLAVAAFAVWFFVVGGLKAETEKTERRNRRMVGKLKSYASMTEEEAADPEAGLPEKPIVEYWDKVVKMLHDERKEIERQYRKIDKQFENVFTADARGDVNRATFVTALRRATEKDIQEKYAALLPEGEEFAKVFPIADPPPQDDGEVRPAQKRFYIGKALAQAAKASQVETIEKVEFDFIASAGAADDDDRRDRRPGIEVQRLRATMSARMPISQVATLVSELLKEEIAVFTVDRLVVEKAPFGVGHLEAWNLTKKMVPTAGVTEIKSLGDDVYIGDCDQSKPESKDPPAQLSEPSVRVALEVSVLDFDIPERDDRRR
jgi:hypothetical protein